MFRDALQCDVFVCTVHYNRPLKDRPRIFTIPHDRNYIWTQCKVQDSRHLGTYQPEVDGYKVCCAQLGELHCMSFPL